MQKLKQYPLPKLFAALAAMAMTIPVPVMAGPGDMLFMGICDPDGVVRTAAIPVEREGDETPEDCAKACHAMCSRKKAAQKA